MEREVKELGEWLRGNAWIDEPEYEELAEYIIKAGWRKLRMATTHEELTALDVGAIIRDAHRDIYEKGVRGTWLTTGAEGHCPGYILPALVIWEEGNGR